MSAAQIILAIVLGLVANEMFDLCPWLAVRLVALAARLQYGASPRAEERSEVFAAYINDRPGKLFKLLTALAFLAAGAVGGLRRRGSAPDLEVCERIGGGIVTIALGGLVYGIDPVTWPVQTTWSMTGGVILMLGGIVQVAIAYVDRPWYIVVRRVEMLACSVGLALGATGRVMTLSYSSLSTDFMPIMGLSGFALMSLLLGLTYVGEPDSFPSVARGCDSTQDGRRSEGDDPD
ncbi:hypothetical protein ACIBCT_38780 [Streptosporangium sp. NPDC050855]|uniref:hypothetical protein n=1 Tax=Streptosporangium sp. NPDC050855 TaxID=3366194 RepID=UPI00379EB1D4